MLTISSCNMKLLHFLFQLFIVSYSTAYAAPVYSIGGCPEKCGNVVIPYPFGIGSERCYLNDYFAVNCTNSRPYLTSLNQEVLNISLENQTVTINSSTITSDCAVSTSIDLSGTPFLFSRDHNKFTVIGCGNALLWDPNKNQSLISGCSSICNSSNTLPISRGCYGIGCCQSSLPYYLQQYSFEITRESSIGGGRGCGVSEAFLVDDNLFDRDRYGVGTRDSFVPIALHWIFSDRSSTPNMNCDPLELDLGNGTYRGTWQCACGKIEEGNPYLPYDGCHVVEKCNGCDECQLFPDGSFTCINFPYVSPPKRSSSTGVILGITISVGALILVAGSFWLYKYVRTLQDKRQKARFFKLNGGLLFQQQVSSNEGSVEKTKIFTAMELEKATDHFNENRILGRGGQGTVFKGMLSDGRLVAVKKSMIVDRSQLEQFINEVVILSQINHRNIVKLLGCCLETEVPLLVYEYISSGTLFEHIHDDEFPLSWNMRLRIASEVAGALAYLHSAASIPIYHRDIKSTNILLDDKHKAKVSDFGTSRSVSVEQTHLTTLVKGTFGYLDPEYFQSSQFTEKSDVYSFGVVLVELLTGERPISSTRTGEHRSLATHFMLAMEEDKVYSILDDRVVSEGSKDEVMGVAKIAYKCLNLNGKNRPTMKEVAAELEYIRMVNASSSSTGGANMQKKGDKSEAETINLPYHNSFSTGISFDSITNS